MDRFPAVMAVDHVVACSHMITRELGKLPQGDFTKVATANLSHTNIWLSSMIMNCTNNSRSCDNSN